MTRLDRSWLPALERCLLCAAFALIACVPRERPGEKHSSKAAAPKPSEARPMPPDPATAAAPDPEIGAAAPAAPASAPAPSPAPAEPDTSGDPLLTEVLTDDFQRPAAAAALGPNWRVTSPAWAIRDGRLCGENARNHPVWLARRLPVNAVIEFSAITESDDGDLKAEYWGDGRSSASGQSYTDATSYLTIFGGWKNRFHVLARLDEHAPDRKEIKLVPGGADLIRSTVVPHRVYQFRVERNDGRTLRWRVDDVEILTYPDDEPLTGEGHEHFGFNDWQVPVCFDNLRVTPLKD